MMAKLIMAVQHMGGLRMGIHVCFFSTAHRVMWLFFLMKKREENRFERVFVFNSGVL